jgi:hypothetical protein
MKRPRAEEDFEMDNESSAMKPAKGVQELIEETLDVQEVVEAMNDPKKADELRQRNGWTQDELQRRFDFISNKIAAGLSDVNVKLKMCF